MRRGKIDRAFMHRVVTCTGHAARCTGDRKARRCFIQQYRMMQGSIPQKNRSAIRNGSMDFLPISFP
ncbi:hypothetical protein PPH41_42240 [Burkholderia gladioli]|nr:hypothetical protein [Burkholderia gladioli]